MGNFKSSISIYWILGLVISGSFVRFIFGFFHEPWATEADHIAWEIVIQNGNWNYSNLIHYPHEGGSILISIAAKIWSKLLNNNALASIAFIVDFIVRCIQLFTVSILFRRNVSFTFGVFTVFAFPFMIPWGTANFGLHYISSMFPFILLIFLQKWNANVVFHILFSSFIAFTIWFSYINLVLIPVSIIGLLFLKKTSFNLPALIIPFLSIIIMHLWVRYSFDPGFHLPTFSDFGIRDTEFQIWNISTIKKLVLVPNTIANAASVSSSPSIHFITKILFLIFSSVSIIGFFRSYKTKSLPNAIKIASITIVSFLIIYSISPFFQMGNSNNYVSYRHLTFIFPLLGLWIIYGIQFTRHNLLLSTFFIITGLIGTIKIMEPRNEKPNSSSYNGAGWVLAHKFGHSPDKLISLIEKHPKQQELITGIGWGSTTAIFHKIHATDSIFDTKVYYFLKLMKTYPDSYSPYLKDGFNTSFSPGITPVLDGDIKSKIELFSNSKMTNISD